MNDNGQNLFRETNKIPISPSDVGQLELLFYRLKRAAMVNGERSKLSERMRFSDVKCNSYQRQAGSQAQERGKVELKTGPEGTMNFKQEKSAVFLFDFSTSPHTFHCQPTLLFAHTQNRLILAYLLHFYFSPLLFFQL